MGFLYMDGAFLNNHWSSLIFPPPLHPHHPQPLQKGSECRALDIIDLSTTCRQMELLRVQLENRWNPCVFLTQFKTFMIISGFENILQTPIISSKVGYV